MNGITDLDYEGESPLAPPADLLEQLAPYDWPVQDGGWQRLPPPSELQRKLSEQRCRPIFLECRIPIMTEEMARNALLSFVNSKCCYGNRAAGELVIQGLKQQALYRYRLETYNESRLSEWTFEPFTNHSVDGPQKGTSPRPWDIKVQVPPMFQEETKKLQVPHSSTVKMRCATCSGAKRKAKQQRRCQMCSGSGRKRCSTCSGRGNKTCATCKGEKRLIHFIQLIITWKNNLFEFVSEHQLNFPGELLTKVKGENIFKDENVMVYPIIDFPKPEISLASQRGIAEHNAAFASRSRILQQRQTIELIPLTEVHYRYQGKTHLYYVYGMENKVYALDYPERYCCGCTII
uniref:Ssu-2 homolog n=1 Tax=Ornithorhynchus anatinus TaxID=9258 RepID=A0A6I8NHN6_ORNAN